MKSKPNSSNDGLTRALKAIADLWGQELHNFCFNASGVALGVHSENEAIPAQQRSAAFYKHFLPLRENSLALLGNNYRRYFKVGLAQPRVAGSDPHEWALVQLQPAIYAAADWICDWYILACSGENRFAQTIGSMDVVVGETASLSIPLAAPAFRSVKPWHAPAWLFSISLTLTGIGLLKQNHIPATDSEEQLSDAHTRLILKGARRVFFWDLAAVIKTIRNEETVAAASIPAGGEQFQGPNAKKRAKRPLRDLEGLGAKKAVLSRYVHALTDKQQLAFSLKYEYGLGPTEIASRMGIDRKTAYEHLKAANRNIKQVLSSERRKSDRAKNVRE